MIFRAGRRLAPSTPANSSTLPALPPQPSWRMWAMMSRSDRARCRAVGVHLVQHPILAAAVAGDAYEPGGERRQRLIHRLASGGQQIVAVAAPVPLGIGRGVT